MRFRLMTVILWAAMACSAATAARAANPVDGAACDDWPDWQRFKQWYLSADGRVIDASTPQRITVSEGQAYALVFALAANDPAAFASIVKWTRDNLAGGDLGHTLAAWKWGHAADGQWRILDANSAADADLWMTYALAEAGRLWRNPGYVTLAHALADSILRSEVGLIPGLGPTLLPGPQGFVTAESWRLNPSYLPLQALRLVGRGQNPLWDDVQKSSLRVLEASAPRGFAADWLEFGQTGGFRSDALTHGIGSYEAIRVYLWVGMLGDTDPVAKRLTREFAPMATLSAQRQAPPESIDTHTLEVHGDGPAGFSAALLPLLTRLEPGVVAAYRARITAAILQDDQHYYSDALALFGLGWVEGRLQFERSGELRVTWSTPCRAP